MIFHGNKTAKKGVKIYVLEVDILNQRGYYQYYPLHFF